MAIEYATITGEHATGYQDDAPCLYASRRGSAGRWNADGGPATADVSDTSYPAVSARDGGFAIVTRPNAAAAEWWYVLTLDTTVVDAVMLHLAAVGLAGGASESYFYAYLSDGTTDHEVATGVIYDSGGLIARWFLPELQVSGDTGSTQRRFTGVTYLKIKFSVDTGTCRPQLTECSAGRARQMLRRPLYSEHDRAYMSSIREHISRSGVVTRSVDFARAKILNERFALTSSTEADAVSDWYGDADGGEHKTIWCPRPLTAPGTAWLMNIDSADIDIPRSGPSIWDFTISGQEDGGSLLVDE